jgi:hypothetical protein
VVNVTNCTDVKVRFVPAKGSLCHCKLFFNKLKKFR